MSSNLGKSSALQGERVLAWLGKVRTLMKGQVLLEIFDCTLAEPFAELTGLGKVCRDKGAVASAIDG